MALPTFLVIGAAKAATTSLFEYVRTHPAVYMPERKELSFFVAELNWRRGLEWYSAQLAAGGCAAAVGEASPTYAWWPSFSGVPQRMSAVVPDVRLIYLVRHPLERMRSMYLHAVALGRERRSASRAFLETPDYLECSRYATQLERYLDHFDRDRLLVLLAEDLRRDRGATLRRVFEFIGVDSRWRPPNIEEEAYETRERFGAAAPLVDLPQSLEDRLTEALRPEVERLRGFLSNGFDGWGLG